MAASTSDQILEAALGLPSRERMRIARNLLQSIEDEAAPEEGWEEAWRVEIERRLAEVREGVVKLDDPMRVLKELRAAMPSAKKKRAAAKRASTKRRHRSAK